MNLIEQIKINDTSIDGYQGSYYSDNIEYVQMTTDVNGRILEGIKTDGSKYITGDLIVDGSLYIDSSLFNINQIIEDVQEKVDEALDPFEETLSFFEPTKNPEWLLVTIDSQGKIINGIKTDGTTFISNLDSPSIKTNNNIGYAVEVKNDICGYNTINSESVVDYFEKLPGEEGVFIGNKEIFGQKSLLSEFSISMYQVSSSDIGSPYKFYIGTVDQRGWILPRIELTKNVSNVKDGCLFFDFKDDDIIVNELEMIYFYAHPTVIGKNESTDKTVSLWNNVSRKNITYANIITDSVSFITSSQCNYPDVKMKYTFKPFESIFTDYLEFSTAKENIISLTETVSKKQNAVLEDVSTGTKYKILVCDGEIILKDLNYSKILCLGNSYTAHGYGSVWPSDGRSMAASKDECMYAKHLENVIGCVTYRGWVGSSDGQSFERGLPTKDSNVVLPTTAFDIHNVSHNISNIDFDCVIVQLGENIVSTDTEKIYSAFMALFEKIKKTYKTADIFAMFGKMYGNKINAVCESIEDAARNSYISLADCSNVSLVDHYQYRDYVSDDNGNLVEVDNAVYASHPSDMGMYYIANKLLNMMGFANVDNRKFEIHKIQAQGGTITTPCDFWISSGVVTVRCVAENGYNINNIQVVTDSGNIVNVTRFSATYEGFTFIMPQENITITPVWSSIQN